MRSLPLALVLALLSTPAAAGAATRDDPLGKAKALLDAGQFESVLDAVNEAKGALATEAAAVLARAGQLALDKRDHSMAALYCEMSLKRGPGERKALEVCLRVAVADEHWEDANTYGDVLGKLAPKDAEIALLRAQAAFGEAEWARAVAILKPVAGGAQASKVRPMLEQAQRHLDDERSVGKQQRDLEARLAKAVVEARLLGQRGASASTLRAGSERSEPVLYTTSWCGVCKRAKAWLAQQHIAYVEKDVEQDREATQELARRCAEAHIRPGGVPVLDARGKLLVGFDAREYAALLR